MRYLPLLVAKPEVTLPQRMLMALMVSVIVLLALCASGCASKVILVHPTKDIMKTAEPIKGKVFVFSNGQWIQSQNRVTIPAGYTILYVEPVKQ